MGDETRRYRDGWKRVAVALWKRERQQNARWMRKMLTWVITEANLTEERDRAVASAAALLHAYIGITPGATVDGLAPEVQAAAERLLEERLALEAERDDLRDECQALRAALASVGVRDA